MGGLARETLKLARDAGLLIERGTNHWKCIDPETGRTRVVIPFRINRDRGKQRDNIKAELRRVGRERDQAAEADTLPMRDLQ